MIARVWAVNLETGLTAPSDGWDCNPIDGQGSLLHLSDRSVYDGEVEDCLPLEGGKGIL